MSPQNNPFLTELLQLQQDGSRAISAPSNWVKNEPLLKVQTSLDELVDSLKTKLESNLDSSSLIWNFFIGIYFFKILSLPINRFMNYKLLFAILNI